MTREESPPTGPAAQERRRTQAWGSGETAATPRCIHDVVRGWAREQPDAPAVVCGDAVVSYRELCRRAWFLASRLAARGVRPDSVVGIRAGRSVELVVAMLAVLAAGGAYLVVDGEQPPSRVRRLLGDARPALILVQRPNLAEFPGLPTEVVTLEDELRVAEQDKRIIGLPPVNPDDLAYVSYTSGSTGEPKGVAVAHRGVHRLVRDPDWAVFGRGDVFLQVAPVAFDASTFEIWGALLNGGTLVVPPPGPVTTELLAEAVQNHGVTVLHLTAGLFHQIAFAAPEIFQDVRHLLAGGDVVSSAHVAAVLTAHPQLTFTHAYGPTENTTFTTCWTSRGVPPADGPLPIGRPIRGTRVAILDEALLPVAVGAVGEIFTGGEGLARGYHGRPADTAERFLPDPLSAAPGARMYRTGDLARWREDGTIEFLGRSDTQVKIRGYRVELGEIEATLRDAAEVQDAVVLVCASPSGEPEIVAYVVAAPDPLDAAGLGTRLSLLLGARLPRYMIPRAFLSMSAFPLNANGKVDRAALAQLRALDCGRGPARQPMTEVERVIAAAWREVLGTDVGVHENFFEAGGSSMLLIRLRARLRQALKREIATVTLFNNPTIHDLACHLSAGPAQRDTFPAKDPSQLARRRQARRERANRCGRAERG